MARHKVLGGTSLYRVLFYGVILTALSVGLLVFWGVREVRRDAAVVAVENSARGLAGTVTVLVNTVTSSNREMGIADLSGLQPERLRKTFVPAMKDYPDLVSVMVSDEHGLRYILSRVEGGNLKEGVPEKGASPALHWYSVGETGRAEDRGLDVAFDLASANAVLSNEFSHLSPEQINWRSANRFLHQGESWLTASTLIKAAGHKAMVSYVFPVEGIAARLAGAEKGSAEKIFLYWDNGKAFSLGDVDGGDQAMSDTVSDPVIEMATSRLSADGGLRGAPFSFKAGDAVWWAYVMPLTVFGDTLSLGVAVPMRNVTSTLTSDTFLQVFGGLLVLLAGGALVVLRRNRLRIEAMGGRQKVARTAEDVLHLIAEGESDTLEFKQTLRFNLKSGRNGREIEHASLKTVAGFLNSEGGTLLVGVADNGAMAGFAEDGFGSADKALLHFNNLVNQHIGTEFASYINTSIIEVQGREILRVHCLPAQAPAFLDTGKVEEFYVRSGPASRTLTHSQFYEWLQKHR